MKTKYDLELSILSCLLQKPELMKKVKFEDKHFTKYKKFWIFIKQVYERFGDFDLTLMTSISKNKFHIMQYIEMIIDTEPAPSRFESYQEELIRIYESEKKEEYLKERIYEIATSLYVGNITLKDFEPSLKMAYKSSEALYKNAK